MGNITISLTEEDEKLLRKLAEEKFKGRKGSLAKVVSEGLAKTISEKNKDKAFRKLIAEMDKGHAMGKIKIKHRSEVYDRR